MAIIPLRAYIREIEGQIDNGQLDEAVAHCRHILTTYPKYIAAYRLLGKAHLEQQRISDATDIFQRVLSAIPDDFVANVGMSIIREDENNLDAAIWHMELAYEAQPANAAIQDELRRLYGRRDGMQPPRVRLTRGALARMYAKGGLYDQAIAELRAAVSEDPNRSDLQLLLANMYYQTSQRVEAVETAANLIKKLPFCLEANRILAISLPEAEGTEAIRNYRQAIISMDPYYAYADKQAITSDQVPDDSVSIERLEWKSGLQIPEAPPQPTWATSLGISLEKPAEENLPEWLKNAEAAAQAAPIEPAGPSVSPFIWDSQEAAKAKPEAQIPAAEIPDWMKEAGWQPATKEAIQAAPTPESSEGPPSPEATPETLDQAEIPDWLRGMAPEGALDQNRPAPPSKEGEVSIPWLETHQPGPTDSIIQWLEETQPETPAAPEPAPEKVSVDFTEEEMPDWLKDLDILPSPAGKEGKPAAGAPAFVVEPVATEPAKTPEAETLPPETVLGVPVAAQPQPIEEIKPAPEAKPAEPAEELPDWLKELAVEEPIEKVEAVTEEQPISGPARGVGEEIPAAPEGKPVAEGIAAAGMLITAAEMIERKEAAPTEEVPAGEEIVPPVAVVTKELVPATEEIIPAAEAPIPVEIPAPAPEIPPAPTPVVAEAVPSVESPLPAEEGYVADAAALAWLESLAAQQGAKEEELITPPSERPETAPEWVKLEAEAPIEEAPAEVVPAVAAEEIPEWIKGLGEEAEAEATPEAAVAETTPEAGAVPEEELPAWLIEMEQPEPGQEPLPSLEQKPAVPAEELPEWMKQVIETPSTEEAAPVISLPAMEQPPVEAVEQPPEWRVEEAAAAAVLAEKAAEAEPEAPAWVPAAEEAAQPAAVETAAAGEDLGVTTGEAEGIPSTPVEEISEADQEILTSARQAINEGLPAQAAELYASLIAKNVQIDEVIKDLQDAIYRFPIDTGIWVSLGDAYFKTEALQEALDAYTKAEELVR